MIPSWYLSSTSLHQFSIEKKALFCIRSGKIQQVYVRTDYCARFGNDRKCFHAFHYALKQILSLKEVSWTPQSFILRGSRAEKLRVYILKSARLSFTYCTIWDKPKTSKKHKKQNKTKPQKTTVLSKEEENSQKKLLSSCSAETGEGSSKNLVAKLNYNHLQGKTISTTVFIPTKQPGASRVVLVVKNLPSHAGDIRDVGSIPRWEDPLQEGMVTLSSIPAWRIPWTEEPGGLQGIGPQRVRHN